MKSRLNVIPLTSMRSVVLASVYVMNSFISGSTFAQDKEIDKVKESKKHQLPAQVKQFLDWELNANAFDKKPRGVDGKTQFKIQHFEVPLAKLKQIQSSESSEGSSQASKIESSLIFEKDGEKYVRWIINPEDTKFNKILMKKLKLTEADKKEYFDGYLTASRSILLQDPVSGHIFTGKVSTNRTGGNWNDKGVNFIQAEKARLASRLIERTSKRVPYKFMVPLYEPTAFVHGGQKPESHGFITRDLHELAEGKKYYMPGFAAIHSVAGKKIAQVNGSKDPAQFWKEHFAIPLGKAFAEYAAYHGLSYASAHSQQFAIELDEKMKPTGRIILRDFNDSFALDSFFASHKAPENAKFLKTWMTKYRRKDLRVKFDIFRGSGAPNWLSESEVDEWADEFYEAFENTFSQITGVAKNTLNAGARRSKLHSVTKGSKVTTYKIANAFGTVRHSAIAKYLQEVPCYQEGVTHAADGRSCEEVLAELHQRIAGIEDTCQ